MTEYDIRKAFECWMMTENDVRKALECCRDSNCHECPIKGCTDNIFGEALNLLNRKDEKIERLRRELANKYRNCTFVGSVPVHTEHLKDYARFLYLVKSEAIKEFAERLKLKLQWDTEFENTLVFENDIDNLVKEMTEGNENDRA